MASNQSEQDKAMRSSFTIANVQPPIIPLIGQWTRNTPGTLSLGQGMVAYPPPASAMKALQDFGTKPAHHLYGEHLGCAPLVALLKAKLLAENGIDTYGSQVVVTAGANMAFLQVLMAIVDPGDEVILPLPYYFNQEMAIRMLNAVPVGVATDANYQLSLPAIEAAITSKTRAIVTISPNNPTGALYSEESLRAVNALCQARGLYHISDEAYEYFVYEDAKHFSPGSIAGAAGHTISLYSLSKAYGFASWRIGYALVPEVLLPALTKIQDTNLICPPLITQYAAIGALEAGASYCRAQLAHLEAVRHVVLTHLQQSKHIKPSVATTGAFYQFINLATDQNDLALAKALITDFKVAAVPGCAFGLEHGCFLRISFGMLDLASITIALERLLLGLETLIATEN